MTAPAHNFRTYFMTLRTQAVLEVTGAPTMRVTTGGAAANGIPRSDQPINPSREDDRHGYGQNMPKMRAPRKVPGGDVMIDLNAYVDPDPLRTAFERAQDAMITEFVRMLRNGEVRSLSEAAAIVGDIQRDMLRIATAKCGYL